jgi:virginiamycin B lyase
MPLHPFASRSAVMALGAVFCLAPAAAESPAGPIVEFPVAYPGAPEPPPPGKGCPHRQGSTHEITHDEKRGGDLWVTGQNYDQLVQLGMDGGMTFHPMPKGSGPHGIEFDAAGALWLTLEFQGKIVRVETKGPNAGKIAQEFDVDLHAASASAKIPTNPHGLGIGADGKTVWFTGKATGTIGRITPDGKVATFPLQTVGAVPIYIKLGPDGHMWATELVGNKIARVSPEGTIQEFAIPTSASRPIAIVPGPDGRMWFSQEAGNKVARIDAQGKIDEFPVPKMQDNMILAGLAFDGEGNLWTQQYVDTARPYPAGPDYLVKIDRKILGARPGEISEIPITFYRVPTENTVMHRIHRGPDGNLWFTELKADKVGRLSLATAKP